MAANLKHVEALPHHAQKEACPLRAAYRQGRKDTAVKVYTINLESTYLLIIGVPAVGACQELEDRCREYGDLLSIVALDEYPAERFTEVYLVRYEKLQSARVAKRRLDSSSFFGGVLHVCFAPEFESIDETREKLVARQKYVAFGTKSGFTGPWEVRSGRNKDTTSSGSMPSGNPEPETYIWAGKTYYAQQAVAPPAVEQAGTSGQPDVRPPKTTLFVPRQAMNASKRRADVPATTTTTTAAAVAASIQSKLQTSNAPGLPVTLKRRKTCDATG